MVLFCFCFVPVCSGSIPVRSGSVMVLFCFGYGFVLFLFCFCSVPVLFRFVPGSVQRDDLNAAWSGLIWSSSFTN